MTGRNRFAAALLAAALAALVASTAGAISLPERTFRVSTAVNGTDADGRSSRPAVSPDGRTLAFDSQATNLDADLNGPIRDVFLRRLPEQRTTLVSEALSGGGDADSYGASITGDIVAFVSAASNLVEGDTNGAEDVFLRDMPGPVVRVSIAPDGTQPDAGADEPDLSEDGRFVAFTSAATNLVPGDTNGAEDVFVKDLTTGALQRISDVDGRAADGRSRGAAISADGRYVAFVSTAPDLVPGDTNFAEDVFVYDRLARTIELASVSSREDQQDVAVAPGFSQRVDISGEGRYVVFDSDSAILVRGDRNQDTDVFVRDRKRGRTRRASIDSVGREGDNDSFYPSISANGRYVVFNSFAENLAPGDARDEDVFLRDLRTKTTTLANVTADDRRRGKENVDQLLQRPSVSRDADVIAFTSTAGNFVQGDRNSVEDVFVRILTPPTARLVAGPSGTVRGARPAYRLGADDDATDRWLCTIDGFPFECGRKGRLPALGNGEHVLRVRAGGGGMRFEQDGLERRFRVVGASSRKRPLIQPHVSIKRPRGGSWKGRRVSGRAGGGAGVTRVQVLVLVRRPGKCRYFDGTKFVERACQRLLSVEVRAGHRWSLRLGKLPEGRVVVVRARAIDRSGNRSRDAVRFFRR